MNERPDDTPERLRALHQRSFKNSSAMIAATAGRCFYCIAYVRADEVHEWCDDGETVLCPFCGIDSVVPDPKLSVEAARELNVHYFTGYRHAHRDLREER